MVQLEEVGSYKTSQSNRPMSAQYLPWLRVRLLDPCAVTVRDHVRSIRPNDVRVELVGRRPREQLSRIDLEAERAQRAKMLAFRTEHLDCRGTLGSV